MWIIIVFLAESGGSYLNSDKQHNNTNSTRHTETPFPFSTSQEVRGNQSKKLPSRAPIFMHLIPQPASSHLNFWTVMDRRHLSTEERKLAVVKLYGGWGVIRKITQLASVRYSSFSLHNQFLLVQCTIAQFNLNPTLMSQLMLTIFLFCT